uniref:IP07027p n=1 Tax=Drosophila melanogaster TaxID=7227 RepID=C3KGJ4_DROME|nr:IP07027p [Drosophila melanogaster]
MPARSRPLTRSPMSSGPASAMTPDWRPSPPMATQLRNHWTRHWTCRPRLCCPRLRCSCIRYASSWARGEGRRRRTRPCPHIGLRPWYSLWLLEDPSPIVIATATASASAPPPPAPSPVHTRTQIHFPIRLANYTNRNNNTQSVSVDVRLN